MWCSGFEQGPRLDQKQEWVKGDLVQQLQWSIGREGRKRVAHPFSRVWWYPNLYIFCLDIIYPHCPKMMWRIGSSWWILSMHFNHIAHVLKLNNTTFLASPHLFPKMGKSSVHPKQCFPKMLQTSNSLLMLFKHHFHLILFQTYTKFLNHFQKKLCLQKLIIKDCQNKSHWIQ